MKKILLFSFFILVQVWFSVLVCQENDNNSSFIRSIQGTWAYSESGADLWMKVVIKRRKLKAFAAYPEAGRYTAESVRRLKEVRLVYKGKRGAGTYTESFAQIVDAELSDDRIYLRIIDGNRYLVFGKKESQRFMKVREDYDPWK